MIKYGLKNKKTGKLLGVYVSSNGDEAEFCNGTDVQLEDDYDNFWLCDSAEHALKILNNPTPWYNSSYENPGHTLNKNDYVVVKVTMNVEEV